MKNVLETIKQSLFYENQQYFYNILVNISLGIIHRDLKIYKKLQKISEVI